MDYDNFCHSTIGHENINDLKKRDIDYMRMYITVKPRVQGAFSPLTGLVTNVAREFSSRHILLNFFIFNTKAISLLLSCH